MQPRYFIGITLPEKLSAKISQTQQTFLSPGKVMDPLVPHITLLNPNVLMTSPPSYFLPKARLAATRLLPITIELTHFEMFDNRVLYIAVNSDKLITLHGDLAQLLPEKVRAQYYVGRQFTPHLTIVQAKPQQTLSPDLVHQYRQHLAEFLPFKFVAPHLTVFIHLSPRTYMTEVI
jgi:2'-5' RNA ligase